MGLTIFGFTLMSLLGCPLSLTKENKPSHPSLFLRSWSIFIATALSRNEQSPARGCPCSLPLTSSHMGQLAKLFSWQQLFSGALPVSPETCLFTLWQTSHSFAKLSQCSQLEAKERANPSHLLQSCASLCISPGRLGNTQRNSNIF